MYKTTQTVIEDHVGPDESICAEVKVLGDRTDDRPIRVDINAQYYSVEDVNRLARLLKAAVRQRSRLVEVA